MGFIKFRKIIGQLAPWNKNTNSHSFNIHWEPDTECCHGGRHRENTGSLNRAIVKRRKYYSL